MKKGFTLIELLAVIIILAILMVVAVPNVLGTLNDAKKKTFVTQAQSIWKAAEQKFIVDSLTGSQSKCYDLSNPLDLGTVSDSISYVVEMDVQTGKVVSINVLDTTQNFKASGTTTNGITVSVESSNTALVCGGSAYLDGTIPVAPKLGNMVPIKWDGSKWVYAKVSQKWYDYSNREWANAVVLSESAGKKKVGDEIKESDIDLWFVWIPRYEYKLPSGSIGTTGVPNAIDIKFIDSTKSVPTSGYSFHPGFAWDSDWSNGISEWKDGIWIGKFENKESQTMSDIHVVKIQANVVSENNTRVSEVYNSSKNIVSDYNLKNLDSHLARYTEWTAVSYLTNSIYGRCTSSNSCTEVTINDNLSYLTGGGNYKTNVNQSTTGNVYGVYDMNGGSDEYVMGYLENIVGASGFTMLPKDNKYTDIFTSIDNELPTYSVVSQINGITSMNGVFAELMSNTNEYYGWYNDVLLVAFSDRPWFLMGGDNEMETNSGVFTSFCLDGSGYNGISFRVALS